VLAILAGERKREVLTGGIGGARANFPIRGFHAVIADQIDHAPAALLDHDRQHVTQAAHVAHELELKTLLPVVFGQMFDDAASCRASIVDHDVDATERLATLLDEILRVRVLAQVRRYRHDLASRFLGNFIRRRFERFLPPGADRNIDAFARQRASYALAYA